MYLHTTASEMRIRFKSTHLTLTVWTVESTLAALIETVHIYGHGQGPRLTLGSKLVWEPDDYISVENISHNITVFCSIYTKYEFDPGFHVLPFLSGFFIFLEYSMKRVGVFDSDKSS